MLQWEKGLSGQLGTARLEDLALTSGATSPPVPGDAHPAAWSTGDKVHFGVSQPPPAREDTAECGVHPPIPSLK